MATTFFISDLHLGHENTFKTFPRADGQPGTMRSFTDVTEMNEHIIDSINSVVRPQDKLYIVGDVVMNKKYLHLVARINGHKRLIMGNHDIFDMDEYTPYFEKILGSRTLANKVVVTHIPVHPSQLEYRFNLNIHGHLHDKNLADPRYFNVSCDNPQMNYVPKSLEEIIEIANSRGSHVEPV